MNPPNTPFSTLSSMEQEYERRNPRPEMPKSLDQDAWGEWQAARDAWDTKRDSFQTPDDLFAYLNTVDSNVNEAVEETMSELYGDYEVAAPEKAPSRESLSQMGPYKGVHYFSNKSTGGELTPMHKGQSYNYPRSTDPSRVYMGLGEKGKHTWQPTQPANTPKSLPEQRQPNLLDPSHLFPAPPGMFYPPR